jgi:hypothetical protein
VQWAGSGWLASAHSAGGWHQSAAKNKINVQILNSMEKQFDKKTKKIDFFCSKTDISRVLKIARVIRDRIEGNVHYLEVLKVCD